MDSISFFFCILTYAIIYVLIHHIIFWLYLYFLNILYFFKYSCTNIFHRCSLCTFFWHGSSLLFQSWTDTLARDWSAISVCLLGLKTIKSKNAGIVVTKLLSKPGCQSLCSGENIFNLVDQSKAYIYTGITAWHITPTMLSWWWGRCGVAAFVRRKKAISLVFFVCNWHLVNLSNTLPARSVDLDEMLTVIFYYLAINLTDLDSVEELNKRGKVQWYLYSKSSTESR